MTDTNATQNLLGNGSNRGQLAAGKCALLIETVI